MHAHYRTQGFILKKTDRGEVDQLFTIYTKDFGKLEILGRAIRKISSKLRSGVEIFYLSEIEFIQGKSHKTLTDTILIENFPILRKDPGRLSIAYRVSEVLDNLVKGQEADKEIWKMLNETFKKLNNLKIEDEKLKIIYYYFLWNLLSILGYQPELYNCSLCQKKLLPEKLYFDLKEGGITCQNCFRGKKSGEHIEPETIKILRVMLEKKWQTLLKLKIESNYLKSLKSISEKYLYHILEGVN
jgi:DNA repair protein RecO (recombination protein O)